MSIHSASLSTKALLSIVSIALVAISLMTTGGASAAGPDVILSDIPSVASFGPVGTMRSYCLGSGTCNIGTSDLEWVNNGSPGLAMNAYRLYNGRLMQIGQGWAKTACCAANGSGCGVQCMPGTTGLHAGCRDVYSAGWNSQQSRLGPRYIINAYTGEFQPLPSGTGDVNYRRLQIDESDMNPVNYPGALYFVEGHYISRGDALAGNGWNNATYQRATFASYQLALADSAHATVPAINAWRDYGNGIGQPDLSVKVVNLDVPGEGRFVAGYKTKDNGNGTWRYEYAVYNLSSDRSGGSFSVPLPPGAVVSNTGFHDVNYHSGEPFANTDWNVTVESGKITWSGVQTFTENVNGNALRWGTMYNFWFDASRGPEDTTVTLGLFKPGTPRSVTMTASGPISPCAADVAPSTGNHAVDVDDLLMIVNAWGPCNGNCPADVTLNAQVDIDDLLAVINAWGPCP